MLERLLVVVHGLLVASLVLRLVRRGPAVLDDRFGPGDALLLRRLALWAVVPMVVLAREGLRALLLLAFGGRPGALEYLVFHAWTGGVSGLALGPALVVHLAPNLAVVAAAAWLAFAVASSPANAARNHLRLEIARGLAGLSLFFYPLLSLLFREWDFFLLRERLEAWRSHAGDAFLLAWGGLAVIAWRFARDRLRRDWLLLVTPLRDALRAAEARVADAPRDAAALRALGRVYLAGEAPARALEALARANDVSPEEPEGRFLAGAAHLRMGAAAQASEELRRAGQLLEAQPSPSPGLVHEVTVALAAARLALGDAEGAVWTVEAARARRPEDARAILLEADALVAAGRAEEAARRLDRAAARAQEPLAALLRRRLAKARKGR